MPFLNSYNKSFWKSWHESSTDIQTYRATLPFFLCVAFSHFATHSRLECCVYSCGYFFTRLPKRVKYFDQFTAYPPISRFVPDNYSMV